MYSPKTQHALRHLRNIILEAAVPPTIGVILTISLGNITGRKNTLPRFFSAITPGLYVSSLIFTLNSRVAISHKFNPPNCKGDSDEELSTGFQFADAKTSGLEDAQVVSV
ncbi:hypothetical protein M407DRAFT_103944 [Tulasnella calospora MUT 4182]|uniref:Uncharacterized protein n=1 Tax=Tulasnella calospora MUT 4182 TaxID=1051891 RepID=A0A0C3PZK7_9AGAM|nr:hypothetical protein M407DRAFT_103944 [Tulasnella calospora MUT 4182]